MGKAKDEDELKEMIKIVEELRRENELLKSQIKDIEAQLKQKENNKTDEEVKIRS